MSRVGTAFRSCNSRSKEKLSRKRTAAPSCIHPSFVSGWWNLRPSTRSTQHRTENRHWKMTRRGEIQWWMSGAPGWCAKCRRCALTRFAARWIPRATHASRTLYMRRTKESFLRRQKNRPMTRTRCYRQATNSATSFPSQQRRHPRQNRAHSPV